MVFGGYPIFADGEIGLAYPPVLLALLTLPAERALIVLRLVHLWIAAIGAFALARAWGLPHSSAILAGVVFSLGHFLQAQIHHENIIRTAAWLPASLAMIEAGLRANSVRRRIAWTAGAAAAIGLAGLSLHSQMLAIDLLVIATYSAFRWWAGPLGARSRIGRFVWIARVVGPATLLGLSLAAAQLVPLIELAGFSARGGGIPYSESAAYSLTPFGLAQLVLPFVFRGADNTQWGLWTHWESYVYIGLAPFVLALIGLACDRRREVVAWGLMGALGLVLALGQYSLLNLHYVLWLLPGLSGLRAPGRFTVLVVLAGGMLAAFGLAWLGRRPSATHWLRLAFGLVALVALAVACTRVVLLAWPSAAFQGITSLYLSLPRDSYALTAADVYAGLLWATDPSNPRLIGALAGLLLVSLAVLAWQHGPRSVRQWQGWPAMFVAATVLDLLVFTWGVHPRFPLDRLGPDSAAVGALERLTAAHNGPARVLASPVLNQVAADQLAPYGIQDANGYSSLQFIWHRDYLGRVLEVDDDLLDAWSVRYVLDPARYGATPSYAGVTFLASHRLLQAPAGSALAEQTFALRPGSTVQEVRLVTALVGAVDLQHGTPVGEVELRSAGGEVRARMLLLAGRDTMEWAYDIPSATPWIRHDRVESAGVIFEPGRIPDRRLLSYASLGLPPVADVSAVTIRALPPRGELMVFGAAAVEPDGTVQQLFGRTKTKFRQVYADAEVRIFENTAALPRAFMVGRARSAPSIGASLSEMAHQPFDPRQDVILANDTPAELAARFSGASKAAADGSARIVEYSPHTVRIQASTPEDALLVLTDTYYPGWQAFVDGQPQPLVRGDLLFRVVPVPAGEHIVEFRFEPSSVRIGLLVSVLALFVAISALVVAGATRFAGRTT
jgi:hypothetical protein